MHLLLAAGVQAVKVINDPPLHVRVVNSPLPVHVTNGPDIWSEVGTVGAIAAAVIALITLFAVLRQIGLAHQQISQVNIQVGLAQEELEAVKTDLANNTAQFNEFMRRPDLTADVVVELRRNRTTQNYRSAWMRASVSNVGQRTTHSYALEILVPKTHWSGFGNAASRSVNTSDDYQVLTLTGDSKPFYPGASPREHTYTFHFDLASSDNPEILWRILDDYGTYPLKQPYGKVTIDLLPI